MPSPVPPAPTIRTPDPRVEVAWFSALCSDDYEFLGVPDGALRSSFEHCSRIVRRADELGYQNILMPSGWAAGQETLPFAAAMAAQTRQINHLVAVRMGEIHPPMLARHLATLDHLLEGRLTVNIISSDLPGLREESTMRYARSREVIEILKQCWTQPELHYRGEFYQLDLATTATRPAVSAKWRTAALLRRHLARRGAALRETLRRLPDVAGDRGAPRARRCTA